LPTFLLHYTDLIENEKIRGETETHRLQSDLTSHLTKLRGGYIDRWTGMDRYTDRWAGMDGYTDGQTRKDTQIDGQTRKDTQTDGQAWIDDKQQGDFISFLLLFQNKESRIKNGFLYFISVYVFVNMLALAPERFIGFYSVFNSLSILGQGPINLNTPVLKLMALRMSSKFSIF
jgi:hypothetical protein